MRLVTYQGKGQPRLGAQLDEQVIDLNRAYHAVLRHAGNEDERAVANLRVPTDMIGLLRGGRASLEAASQALSFVQWQQAGGNMPNLRGIIYALHDVSLLPPVLHPDKIICLGLNYRDHATEAGMSVPDYPILFHKVTASLIGHGQGIVIPRISDKIDYEGELTIIIGRRGKYIAEDSALPHLTMDIGQDA
jgi:acylpyruvate hydrolase